MVDIDVLSILSILSPMMIVLSGLIVVSMVMGVSGFDFAPYNDNDPENTSSHLLIISIHSSVPSIYISHTAILYHAFIDCVHDKNINIIIDQIQTLDDEYIER
jgi:hypothetical protein